MLSKLIEQYCKNHGIEHYELEDKARTMNDWNNPLKLGKDIAVVYHLNAIVNVGSVSELPDNYLVLSSPSGEIDYHNQIHISDAAGVIQLSSGSISFHRDTITVETHISNIYSAHFKYILIKPKN